jgi:hypothetical protein
MHMCALSPTFIVYFLVISCRISLVLSD